MNSVKLTKVKPIVVLCFGSDNLVQHVLQLPDYDPPDMLIWDSRVWRRSGLSRYHFHDQLENGS